MDEEAYAKSYLHETASVIDRVDPASVAKAIKVLKKARADGVMVFLGGNGGSAAICSHFASDLNKTVLTPGETDKRFRALCLNDNIPMLTAWANDTDYTNVFSEPLKNHARAGDVVILVSSSGKSPNIVKAAQTARELGCTVIGMTGFTGGPLRELAHANIHVDNMDYGHVESTHATLCHLLTFALKNPAKK